jgi:hypothetical protein
VSLSPQPLHLISIARPPNYVRTHHPSPVHSAPCALFLHPVRCHSPSHRFRPSRTITASHTWFPYSVCPHEVNDGLTQLAPPIRFPTIVAFDKDTSFTSVVSSTCAPPGWCGVMYPVPLSPRGTTWRTWYVVLSLLCLYATPCHSRVCTFHSYCAPSFPRFSFKRSCAVHTMSPCFVRRPPNFTMRRPSLLRIVPFCVNSSPFIRLLRFAFAHVVTHDTAIDGRNRKASGVALLRLPP